MPRSLPGSLTKSGKPLTALDTKNLLIDYLFHPRDVELACVKLLRAGVVVVGFDIEWRAEFKLGVGQRPVALLQLCWEAEHLGRRVHKCLLIHVCKSGVVPALLTVLESPYILKVGVGLRGDVHKLERDLGCKCAGMADVNDEVASRLVPFASPHPEDQLRWTLADLCERVLQCTLAKDPHVRCGDWEHCPLAAVQVQYAAADALASLLVWRGVVQYPRRPESLIPLCAGDAAAKPVATC